MNQERVLVVTGASRGLGAHIASAAQDAGYRVIGVARSASSEQAYEIRACDVSDPRQVQEFFKSLRDEEDLYGLVNTAGVAAMNLVVATPMEPMQRVVSINLLGTMYCCAAMGKLLARRKRGRIVNFSTIAVKLSLKGEAVYVGSKSGVEGFSRSFAREMADFGVTVNTVAPGPILTDLIRNVPKEKISDVVNAQVIPKMAERKNVWDIVSFLLEERASMISGQVLNVGGA